VQVRQPDRREDPVQTVSLEDGEGVVPVVAGAIVEGEDEAVWNRRAVTDGHEQRIRLERLVVAEQMLDLAFEVGDGARRQAVLVRVADVVVHDQDRAHLPLGA
jgi:hypothetical protein